jgi:SAM-dependent methyltransferase
MAPRKTFDELIAEGAAEPVAGWDFSWFAGRATEERPAWGYSALIAAAIRGARAVLDIQTGGGEVLADAGKLPPVMAATESWPPNLAKATRLLRPRGVVVVADEDTPPLPFADAAFDLVTSRHPVRTYWAEIARVLEPGGTYLSQQVGPRSVAEVTEFFLGPQDPVALGARHPDRARIEADDAGLDVVDLRYEELRTEFHDVGAVVYFLRKVIWIVPGFTVDRYRDRLHDLHEKIRAEGTFRATTTRYLIEARKR